MSVATGIGGFRGEGLKKKPQKQFDHHNWYQTIFRDHRRIGKQITRDIYTKTQTKEKKQNWGKNVFIDVCLPCLFIYSFAYLLFGSGSINYP